MLAQCEGGSDCCGYQSRDLAFSCEARGSDQFQNGAEISGMFSVLLLVSIYSSVRLWEKRDARGQRQAPGLEFLPATIFRRDSSTIHLLK